MQNKRPAVFEVKVRYFLKADHTVVSQKWLLQIDLLKKTNIKSKWACLNFDPEPEEEDEGVILGIVPHQVAYQIPEEVAEHNCKLIKKLTVPFQRVTIENPIYRHQTSNCILHKPFLEELFESVKNGCTRCYAAAPFLQLVHMLESGPECTGCDF